MGHNREADLRFLEELMEATSPERVVMLSAENDAATVDRAIATEAVGFISKSD